MKNFKKMQEYLLLIICAVLVIAMIGLTANLIASNRRQTEKIDELSAQLEAEQEERSNLEQKLQEESAEVQNELLAQSEEIAREESERKDQAESEQKEREALAAQVESEQSAREELAAQVESESANRKQEQKDFEDASAILQGDIQNSNFYQKLSKGYDCSILVLGDEISYGSGSSDQDHVWINLLRSYLNETYSSTVSVNNLSIPGSTSYAGYSRVMMLAEDREYDAVILCYGKNDDEKEVALYYEALIRAIGERFPNCAILSVLEPERESYYAKNGYSGNTLAIRDLCDHYDIPTIDCIQTFTSNYDDLTDRNHNPNNEGQAVFAECIESAIDKMVIAGKGIPNYAAPAIDEGTLSFDEFLYLFADQFERVDDVTYLITDLGEYSESITGAVMGVDYSCIDGANRITFSLDGGKSFSTTMQYRGNSPLRRIDVAKNHCSVSDEIKVTFSDSENADMFNGLIFSW